MVKISNGARVLYQWERGVKLTVTGQCDIVRMSREDDSGAKDFVPHKNGAEKEVEVPDFLLTESGYLRVSIIIRENDTERILETARFIIRPMQKSNNRATSERDVGSWLVLKMRMDALERAAREGKFNGDDGITPHIGENGNWYLADFDTGVQARGEDGITPRIGENGNWFVGDIDTGVKAKNEDVSLYADDLYTSGVLVTDELESFVMTGGAREDGKPQIVTSPGVAYIKGVRRWLNTSRRTYDVRDTDRVQAQYLRLNETTGEIGLAIWHDVTINGDLDNGGEIVDEFTGEVIPKRSGGYYDLILCIATIPAGTTEITPDMIRDLRGDERYCGFVSSKITGSGGGIQKESDPTVPGWAKQPHKPTYTAEDVGAPTKEQFDTLSNRVSKIPRTATPQMYGAKGDGSTDDTAAFQAALAAERVVFVSGGVYKLSGEIVIGNNCMLELSQDTVLEFTNTTGNCINLGMLSNLKGNHATIKVPYWFEGNVLYSYTNDQTNADINAVPPWIKWDPQWKSGRYVTDINICKADSRGFHYAVNPGECKGTAVYISADYTVGLSTFMWGVHYSGLRIAGAFAYGIRAANRDKGWNHEMRIDAFIDACETGVSLEDCNNVYVSAAIQPRRAYSLDNVYAPYAKYGIKLTNSKNADLSGSRVWDWENEDKPSTTENEKTTLWTDGGEYQHIAMYGNCTGTIINDFTYYTGTLDVRRRIYTDDDQNLETLTVLQEPIDRWFKVIGGDPYFNNGIKSTKLLTENELDQFVYIDAIKSYTDVLENATEADDTTIFNKIGYQVGKRFVSLGSGTALADSVYYMTTGFIKIQRGQTIYGKDLTFDDTAKSYAGIVYYNANHERFGSLTAANVVKSDGYWTANYQSTGTSFSVQLPTSEALKNLAYVRFVFPMTCVGKSPSMAIDETMEATYEGFLSDDIKVKGENVVGIPGQVTPDWVATKEESGGNAIVISEQTLSSGMWSNRKMDIVPGITYEVYINDTRYTCVASNEDGGIHLGNNTSMTKNDIPFCVYWAGGSSMSGLFYKDNSLSYPLTLKVTDGIHVIYNKMPVEYLPEEAALKSDIKDVAVDEDLLDELLTEVLS